VPLTLVVNNDNSRQVSLLGVRRVSLAPGIPANHTSPLTSSPSYPIWGEGTKVAEVEHTVPPPSPPSWAEMVRRGTTLPLGQPPSHTPPGPASRYPPPLSAHILQLYKDCVARGIWAKLVFETREGGEEFIFFCSHQPGATAATTAARSSHRQGRKKRPPNKRRREQARSRREAWIERRNCSSPTNNTAVSVATAACTAAAGEKIPAAAATTVSENLSEAAATAACTAAAGEKIPATTVAENLSAAEISAAAVGLAAATTATTAANPVNITVAADVVIGTTTSVKAVATTAAALRERSKVWAGERRSSARASVFEQRRNSLVSASQESPEKLRGAEDLNESFRIQFEEVDMQREELICSSCLSTHHDINNPLSIFCVWKVLE
jgi:hypothetical protein